MPGFATEQFQIAQQDNTNLATETYMSSKKTHHPVFFSQYEVKISGRWT